MNRPSEKALSIAENLLDYTHPGMSRGAAIEEIAGIVDEMNAELLQAVDAVIHAPKATGSSPTAGKQIERLRETAINYRPSILNTSDQHELFTANTATATATSVVAGQMP